MFRRRAFFLVLFGVLLLFGLSGLGQRANYSRGYAQGFAAAQQAAPDNAGGEAAEAGAAQAPSGENARPPRGVYGWGWGWGFFPVFGILGLFFKFWLILAFLGLFMKLFGFGRFHRWHRHKWPGHRPEDAPYEKQPEDVNPGVDYL